MFEIISSLRNISRYYKKSILITCVSMIIMLFVSYYVFLLNDGVNKMNYIYKTTKVEAAVNSKNGSSELKQIPYNVMKKQLEPCSEIKKSYYQAINDILLNKDKINEITKVYATTDIKRELIFDKESTKVEYLSDYNDKSFCGKEAVCIISRNTLKDNNWKLGDSIFINSPIENVNQDTDSMKLKIIGVYDVPENNKLTELQLVSEGQAVYCSFYPFAKNYTKFYKMGDMYGKYSIPFIVSEAKYLLKDSSRVENFREYIIKNVEFYTDHSDQNIPEVLRKNEGISKYKIVIYDEELKQMLGGIKSVVFFLKIALPFVIAILITIGFTISYLITQNRINDIALMRIMGVKRRKTFCMIINEMLLPCIFGGLVSILISQVLYRRWFSNLPGIQFNLLLFVSYILIFSIGASAALSMILKLKPIQVLTKKE